jgi:hypothetical protein
MKRCATGRRATSSRATFQRSRKRTRSLVLFPTQVDLRPWRLLTALAGLLFLLYGFIFESE